METKKLLCVALTVGLCVNIGGCADFVRAGDEPETMGNHPASDQKNVKDSQEAIANAVGLTILGVAIYGLANEHHNSNPGNAPVPSDIRLKRDIHLLATLDSGMKIYSFKYLWSDTAYVGVMAQDLLANPAWRDAVVTSPNGFYAVNYGALGLKMVTLDEWQSQSVAWIKGGERMSVTKQPQALQPAL